MNLFSTKTIVGTIAAIALTSGCSENQDLGQGLDLGLDLGLDQPKIKILHPLGPYRPRAISMVFLSVWNLPIERWSLHTGLGEILSFRKMRWKPHRKSLPKSRLFMKSMSPQAETVFFS